LFELHNLQIYDHETYNFEAKPMSLHRLHFLRAAAYAVLLFSFALLPIRETAAQLLLNDGLENSVSAASSDLEVRDGPGPAPDPTTLNVLDGAAIAEQDDLSIALLENSILSMTGGETAGAVTVSDQAQASVSGGVIGGEVLVEGTAKFTLTGDGLLDNDVAIESATVFEMTGGTIAGEIVLADDAVGTFSGGTLEDTLVVEGNAVVTVHSINAEDNVEAADDAVVQLLGGTFEGSLEAVGDSHLQISGGSFPALFSGGEEVLATEGGRIDILGGEFGEAGEEDDEGGVLASLGSVVNYSGASVAGVAEGNAPTARFSALLNGTINVSNATFGPLSLAAANNGLVKVDDVVADEISVATLAGGTVDIAGGVAESLDVFAELAGKVKLRGGSFAEIQVELVTDSILTVFGHSFTFLGTPVESLPGGAFVSATGELRTIGGELAGILADGSSFSLTFSRQFNPAPGARVFLVQVPEPGSILLAISAVAGLCTLRRRRES
jgi:hypothetical protein